MRRSRSSGPAALWLARYWSHSDPVSSGGASGGSGAKPTARRAPVVPARCPATVNSPSVARVSPAMSRNSVVLPAPFGPMIQPPHRLGLGRQHLSRRAVLTCPLPMSSLHLQPLSASWAARSGTGPAVLPPSSRPCRQSDSDAKPTRKQCHINSHTTHKPLQHPPTQGERVPEQYDRALQEPPITEHSRDSGWGNRAKPHRQ